MIRVEGLTVTFGQHAKSVRAVDKVGFRVANGSAFGLVGESGSGKSTVLRAIAGLITSWSGKILLDGQTLGLRRSPASRRKLQMVFQDPYGSLHPRHTIDRILSEPCRIHGLDRVADRVAGAGRPGG